MCYRGGHFYCATTSPFHALTHSGVAIGGGAYAGDGVIEINQAKAGAGGVTPGDGPGFPVTISEPGSYRLTGNLTVPDENTTGILITTDDVTVDLNGFAIAGPVVCTTTFGPTDTTCSAMGTGSGILGAGPGGFAPQNITVVNGTVRGMGNFGVGFIYGSIERVRAISNAGTGIVIPTAGAGDAPGSAVVECWAIRNGFKGIFAGARSRATANVANFNGSDGIGCGGDCTVIGNTANSNEGNGISCGICTITDNSANSNGGDGIFNARGVVRGNTVTQNTGFGLNLQGVSTGYSENVINFNTAGTVNGGAEMGTNLCNGNTTCP